MPPATDNATAAPAAVAMTVLLPSDHHGGHSTHSGNASDVAASASQGQDNAFVFTGEEEENSLSDAVGHFTFL